MSHTRRVTHQPASRPPAASCPGGRERRGHQSRSTAGLAGRYLAGLCLVRPSGLHATGAFNVVVDVRSAVGTQAPQKFQPGGHGSHGARRGGFATMRSEIVSDPIRSGKGLFSPPGKPSTSRDGVREVKGMTQRNFDAGHTARARSTWAHGRGGSRADERSKERERGDGERATSQSSDGTAMT